MAIMNHQGIAKVFDAGTTDSGQSYFVMELVRGLPISQYCDRHRYTIQQRLMLFVEVCQAIQHAHHKGVIHRDIKPSNVLVVAGEDRGFPVVIDFGVSKAMQQPLGDSSLATQMHQIIGTPAYMSPEQAERSSLDIDTRSDVYSLGVVLYELLCGALPISWDPTKPVSAFDVVRLIREVEPVRPSLKLYCLEKEQQNQVATDRSDSIRSLSKSLHAELDWIVMKCLEKNRATRYATVSGLAQDVQRYLDNEPVLARQNTLSYSIKKFTSKNRGLVAGSFAAFVLLFSALIASGVLMDRLRRDRQGLLLLSDLNKLQTLEAEFQTLLQHPYDNRQQAIQNWVELAKGPLQREYQHRIALQRLAGLEASTSFEQQSREWQFESHTRLVEKLERLAEEGGLLEQAEMLAERTPDREAIAQAWEACQRDLSRFPNWRLHPKPELFPIKNTSTGLWEFVDLRTGSAPATSEEKPDMYRGIQYVLVPGGEFLMGSPEDEVGRKSASEHQHKVTVSPFLIAKYETTQGIWQRMEGYKFNTMFEGVMIPTPASWFNGREFGAKLNADLPSEAQWEYACRAGSTKPFSGSDSMRELGWNIDSSGRKLQPIGLKQPNAFGLFDMHGNAHEWVYDRFAADFYRHPEAMRPDPVNEPEIKTLSEWHQLENRINQIPDDEKQQEEFANYFVGNRSGNYESPARYCRSADRFFGKPIVNITGISFRLVRTDVVKLVSSIDKK